jgi:hypothetical protein
MIFTLLVLPATRNQLLNYSCLSLSVHSLCHLCEMTREKRRRYTYSYAIRLKEQQREKDDMDMWWCVCIRVWQITSLIFTLSGIRRKRFGQPVTKCHLSTTAHGGTPLTLTIGRMCVHDLVKLFKLRLIISFERRPNPPQRLCDSL